MTIELKNFAEKKTGRASRFSKKCLLQFEKVSMSINIFPVRTTRYKDLGNIMLQSVGVLTFYMSVMVITLTYSVGFFVYVG